VYKASAGAGKTYTQAAEFIANLLNDFKTTREPHCHQLAITFTRKATTEMKERILENLYELAHCVEEQQAFLNVVRQKLLVPASDREISLMTRSLLREILHGYDRFHVTTIDSFFQSLLSNLAHELGLTATFKVDLNNDDLLQRGVDKMLQGLESDSQELKWVSQYIEQRLEDDSDKSWRVEHSLSNLARELTKESYVKQRRLLQNFTLDNDLAKRYRDVLHSLKKNSIEEIQQSAQDAEDFIVGSEGYSRISRGGDVEKYLHRAMEYKFSTTDPSNTVLKNMNRKYTREDYLEKVAAIRRIIPNCGLTTDIFVGYHNETLDDQELTLSLVRECQFDSAFMFKYSERPGTYAAKHLPDNISEEEKVRRLNELIKLQTEISAAQNKKDEGKEFDVLIERFSKRSREQLMGRTEQNKAVIIPRGKHHIGQTVRVRITGSSSATLIGEVVE